MNLPLAKEQPVIPTHPANSVIAEKAVIVVMAVTAIIVVKLAKKVAIANFANLDPPVTTPVTESTVPYVPLQLGLWRGDLCS